MDEYGIGRYICPGATVSNKNPAWTGLGSNLSLLGVS